MAMNAKNMALLRQLTGREPDGANVGGNVMLQQLNQGGAATPPQWGGRKQALKSLATQNGLTDPNGGRFRGREILQGLLAKQQAAATSGPTGPLPGGGEADPIAGGLPVGRGGIDYNNGGPNPTTGGIDPVVAPPPGAMQGGNVRPMPAPANAVGGPEAPGMVGFAPPPAQGIAAGGHQNGIPAGQPNPQQGALIGQNPNAVGQASVPNAINRRPVQGQYQR